LEGPNGLDYHKKKDFYVNYVGKVTLHINYADSVDEAVSTYFHCKLLCVLICLSLLPSTLAMASPRWTLTALEATTSEEKEYIIPVIRRPFQLGWERLPKKAAAFACTMHLEW
jgi:hypothetical protein